jgi:hypothetical protein
VPIDSLRDDRYTWRENTHEIIGERTGRCFRAGDQVQVILDRILAAERKLQFSIVEEGIPLTGKPPPNPTRKPRKRRPPPRLGAPSKPERNWAKRAGGGKQRTASCWRPFLRVGGEGKEGKPAICWPVFRPDRQ